MAEIAVAADDVAMATKVAREVIEDTKGRDLVEIDVRSRASRMFDALLICTATSSRHAAALAERLRVALKKSGIDILGIEGPGEMGWTLIDAGSVVIHIFLQDAREHYDLESLWSVEETGQAEGAKVT